MRKATPLKRKRYLNASLADMPKRRPKARMQALVYGIWYLLIAGWISVAKIHILFENRNGYLSVLLFSFVSLSSPPFAVSQSPLLFSGLPFQIQFQSRLLFQLFAFFLFSGILSCVFFVNYSYARKKWGPWFFIFGSKSMMNSSSC